MSRVRIDTRVIYIDIHHPLYPDTDDKWTWKTKFKNVYNFDYYLYNATLWYFNKRTLDYFLYHWGLLTYPIMSGYLEDNFAQAALKAKMQVSY